MTVIDDIVKKIEQLLKMHMSYEYVREIIKKSYNIGIDEFEKSIQPNINIVPNDKAIDFLTKYTFNNIKDVNDDMAKRLRKELLAAFMNRESVPKIKQRVQETFNVGKVRAAAIARTETHRAYGFGGLTAARQSGLTLKKRVYNRSPQSAICKSLVTKDPIPINEKWSYDGKEYDVNPFHVNCRSRVLYEQVEESS